MTAKFLHFSTYKLLLLTAMAGFFYSCSDDISVGQRHEVLITMNPSVKTHVEVSSRAGLPEGFEAYNPSAPGNFNNDGKDGDIALYFFQGTSSTPATAMLESWKTGAPWDKGMWQGRALIDNSGEYFIHGFMPAKLWVDSDKNEYYDKDCVAWSNVSDEGATLVLTGVPTASNKDVSIIIASAVTADVNDAFNINTTLTPLTLGSFVSTIDNPAENINLYALMDHVYSKIELQMKVDSKYNELRKIKLKKVTMSTEEGTVEITINVGTNVGSGATSSVSFDKPSGTSVESLIFQSKDIDGNPDSGTLLLPDTPVRIPAFFAPVNTGQDKSFLFEFEYDIYTKDGLQLISSRKAQNKWTLTAEKNTLEAGKAFILTATVTPTYLYELTNPDLDNPTIKF